jgi:hypothetical protein
MPLLILPRYENTSWWIMAWWRSAIQIIHLTTKLFLFPPVKAPSKKKILGCWGHHCQIKCGSFGHLRWQFCATCRKTQTVCCKAKEITFFKKTFSYFMFTYTYRMNPRTILTLQVYLFLWKMGNMWSNSVPSTVCTCSWYTVHVHDHKWQLCSDAQKQSSGMWHHVVL